MEAASNCGEQMGRDTKLDTGTASLCFVFFIFFFYCFHFSFWNGSSKKRHRERNCPPTRPHRFLRPKQNASCVATKLRLELLNHIFRMNKFSWVASANIFTLFLISESNVTFSISVNSFPPGKCLLYASRAVGLLQEKCVRCTPSAHKLSFIYTFICLFFCFFHPTNQHRVFDGGTRRRDTFIRLSGAEKFLWQNALLMFFFSSPAPSGLWTPPPDPPITPSPLFSR